MCGIAGAVAVKGIEPSLLKRMAGSIAHRGPDDHGIWIDPSGTIGFAHRRLSIVDLSPHGHQPMASADHRFVICYNGEIYNHGSLRADLDKAGASPEGGWRGHSDTETLIEGIATWGLEETLAKAAGMFAFALWDRSAKTLSLVRDRFGEKPLYYGWAGHDFVFGSELKSIRCHPDFVGDIDHRAAGFYASRTYVPAPWSIYRGIFKLLPGTIMSLTLDAAKRQLDAPVDPDCPPLEGISARRYWSYADIVRAGQRDAFGSEEDALAALDSAMAEAVAGQAVADVPVGAFLSGGIDSSSVVAYYQAISARSVHTYSIGFTEDGFDEAVYAKAVATHFGTVHHEHYVGSDEARDVIPLLPSIYDEPFADSSQIPTFLVSRFARKDVTVALTGDGGDEMFAGYNRHVLGPAMWRRIANLPRPLRLAASKAVLAVPRGAREGLGALLLKGRGGAGAKLDKAARLLGSARDFDELYEGFLDEWHGERSPVLGYELDRYRIDEVSNDPVIRATYADAIDYLPDDILCKVDRASMAVSLETRVPFLDHRVAAVAARIPTSMKVNGGMGKQVLRTLLYRHAPRDLFDRPKAGFAVPVGDWIKGPLKEWAEELLESDKLRDGGIFDPAIVRQRWFQHLSGERDSTPALWAVLMFQAWHAEQCG